MENRRPYWKVLVSLALSLVATIVFIVVGWRLLIFFMPFVLGWFISFIANPLVCWLENRLKIQKKIGSAMIIVTVLVLVIGLFYWGISRLVSELGNFVVNFPDIYAQIDAEIREAGASLYGVFDLLPEWARGMWHEVVLNLDAYIGRLIARLSEGTVNVATNIAIAIPFVVVATIITIISAYIFIAEREYIIQWSHKITPDPIRRRMVTVVENLKLALGGYLKAQLKMAAIMAVILLIGFNILQVNFVILLTILSAVLDFLPIFGIGTALLPWALFSFLTGDFWLGVGLLGMYGICFVVRRIVEPKLIADSMGVSPLVTLVFLYVGFRMGSLLGIILAAPVGMLIINLYKAGTFDYILDDVKILVEGILSLREE